MADVAACLINTKINNNTNYYVMTYIMIYVVNDKNLKHVFNS